MKTLIKPSVHCVCIVFSLSLFLYTVAAMKFNENLQEIWLGNNSLVTEDGQHLGNILRTNHCLKVLDLKDNSLGDAGVKYICAGVSEQAHGLLTLNLKSNSIGPEGFHHVATMLVSWWCPVLVSLD